MKSLLAFLTCLGLNDCNCGEENPAIWSSSREFRIIGFMAEIDCGDIEPICSLEISSKMSLGSFLNCFGCNPVIESEDRDWN